MNLQLHQCATYIVKKVYNVICDFHLLPTRNSIPRVIFIVRFPTYVITKSMSFLQFRSMRLAVVRVHLFLLAVIRVKIFGDVKEQHTYSAAIETLLVCKR